MSYANLKLGSAETKPNQNLNVFSLTTSTLTFVDINQDNTQDKLLVLNQDTDEVEFRNVSSLPGGNPFNQNLNTMDDVVFNGITTSTLTLDNIANRVCQYSITGKPIPGNIDTLLNNWTPVFNSAFINVDPIAGTFSPETGYYAMTYQAYILSPSVSNEIGVRLVDANNNNIYVSTIETNDLMAPETNGEGTQYENLSFFFFTGTSYRLFVKINQTKTCNFGIQISRII